VSRSLDKPLVFPENNDEEKTLIRNIKKKFFSQVFFTKKQHDFPQNPFPYDLDKIPYVFNVNNEHWILVVLDLKARKTVVHDSMLSEKQSARSHAAAEKLQDGRRFPEFKNHFVFAIDFVATLNSLYKQLGVVDKFSGKKTHIDTTGWRHEVNTTFPYQEDEYNCGVFCLLSLACEIWDQTPAGMNFVETEVAQKRVRPHRWGHNLAWKFRLFLAERSLRFGTETFDWINSSTPRVTNHKDAGGEKKNNASEDGASEDDEDFSAKLVVLPQKQHPGSYIIKTRSLLKKNQQPKKKKKTGSGSSVEVIDLTFIDDGGDGNGKGVGEEVSEIDPPPKPKTTPNKKTGRGQKTGNRTQKNVRSSKSNGKKEIEVIEVGSSEDDDEVQIVNFLPKKSK